MQEEGDRYTPTYKPPKPPAQPLDQDPDAWMYQPGGPYYVAPTPQPDYSTMPWQELTPDQMKALQQGAAQAAYGAGGDFATAPLGTLPDDVTAALQQGAAQGQTWGLSTPNPEYYPTYDGGGGGGSAPEGPPPMGGESPSNLFEDRYSLQGAPDWWRGYVSTEQNPELEYASIMNAMIPYLSPEDQRTVAINLYSMYPEWFSGYNPEVWGAAPTYEDWLNPETGLIEQREVPKTLNPEATPRKEVPTLLMQEYTSTKAAEQEQKALEAMASAMGLDAESLGPGYRYIRQVAQALKDFGAPSTPEMGWTPTMKQQYLANIDPLMAAASGSGSALAAFAPLAKMMTQPFFSNPEGRLFPYTNAQNQLTWAMPNSQWF